MHRRKPALAQPARPPEHEPFAHVDATSMSCTLKDDGPCRRTLTFSVDRAELEAEIERRVQSLATRAQFKGFRPGHTPIAMVRKAYGKNVADEARRTIMSRAFEEAIREHKLQPVGEPELNLQLLSDEDKGPFTFELGIEIVPVFDLKPLDSIPVSIVLPPVDESMVSREVERFRQQAAKIEDAPADEPAGDDSVLGASITYTVDGNALPPRADRVVFVKHDLVDSIAIPGAGAAFRGAKVGDSVELQAELPAHFEPAELAGRKAALHVAITGHRRVNVPQLTPELLGQAGCKTEDELRARIREALGQQRNQARAEQVDRAVEAWLIAQHPMDLPERLLAKAVERRVHEVAHDLMERQSMSAEDGHQKAEAERGRITEGVRRSLHASFILARIARDQSLAASAADAEDQVRVLAQEQKQDPETLVQQARREGWLSDVAASLTETRVREWLRGKAEVTETAPTPA
jgi:trigger factor